MHIKPFLSKEKIEKRVKELAKEISKEKELNFITVLEGAARFSDELKKEIKDKVNNFNIKLKSYSGTESSRKIRVIQDIKEDIKGKKVIIVEDILDTGHTLSFLKDYLLNKKKAKSLKICVLLDKPSRRTINIRPDYTGFRVPNKFLVGFGLDYYGKYRRLDHIGEINDNT